LLILLFGLKFDKMRFLRDPSSLFIPK
jgi:hypothetical protein